MIIIKDFSSQSLDEANKFITVLRPNTQLLILNGVNINADNITSIEIKQGPCSSCLIVIGLRLEITLEIEVDTCQIITIEKFYDQIETVLEINVISEKV